MKRPNPSLKKPKLKLPPVAKDLYRDLRDRRLLPLVALALAALVAIPFLLSNSASTPPPPSMLAAEGPQATASNAAHLTVVPAAPGLREPGRRLSHLRAKDPFRQHYTNSPVAPDPSTVTSTTETESSTTEVVAEETSGAPSASPPAASGGSASGNSQAGGGGGSSGAGHLAFYAFAVAVKVVRTETTQDGSKETSELPEREQVMPTTSLPGDKQQVVTYMGISPKTHKPLFLVSTDVTAVFGDAKCVVGSDSCQLLELEEKIPETFVYGANDVRYKLTVLKVEPVPAGHS